MERRYLPHFRRRRTSASTPARGFPCALTGSGSARRSASFLGGVTSTTNHQRRNRNGQRNINKCIVTGRLTKDPELRALPSGTSVCELRLAVNGMGRGRERSATSTSASSVTAARPPPHLGKGWLVAVDGRIEFGEWETQAGEKRHDYSVVGNRRVPRGPPLLERRA